MELLLPQPDTTQIPPPTLQLHTVRSAFEHCGGTSEKYVTLQAKVEDSFISLGPSSQEIAKRYKADLNLFAFNKRCRDNVDCQS